MSCSVTQAINLYKVSKLTEIWNFPISRKIAGEREVCYKFSTVARLLNLGSRAIIPHLFNVNMFYCADPCEFSAIFLSTPLKTAKNAVLTP
jgi:hypothetical protein